MVLEDIAEYIGTRTKWKEREMKNQSWFYMRLFKERYHVMLHHP